MPKATRTLATFVHAAPAGWLARRGVRLFKLLARPVGADAPPDPGALQPRVLDEHDVLRLCHPSLDLRPDAVRAAYARGDLFLGAFSADALCGYCWVAFRPLPHLDGVWVRFSERVAWIYKSFVLPSHRGQGIAATLYRFAQRPAADRGCLRLAICMESRNRASVRAAQRAGFLDAGYGGYVRCGPLFRAWCSRPARNLGVEFLLPRQRYGALLSPTMYK
jgi:GNAT superfamily N-acetyltransferase